MKKYVINTHPLKHFHSISKEIKKNGSSPLSFHFGIDVEVKGVALSVMIQGSTPRYLGKYDREAFLQLVKEPITLDHSIHCVQESCGFGPYLHRDLLKLGANSLIIAPKKLDAKRKTDKSDANKLAQELWDFQKNGNRDRFKVIYDLDDEQREIRAVSRHIGQLQKNRNMLSGNGRSLMHEHGFYEVPEGWWGARKWVKLKAELELYNPWLVGMLEPIQQNIQNLHKRIHELKQMIVEAQSDLPQPKGYGDFTAAVIGNEIADWHRFKNRKQVSSYTGLCPSENSSGPNQRLGAIDRRGNKRIRKQLVEAVWRLSTWNPGWRGFKKFPYVFAKGVKVSGAVRKKAVVACARMLMVDLWRLNTGQTTLENLGLIPAEPTDK